jgi:ppGpp synthetase/RelA/SpoT-type nucleotidyltranferase
MSWANLTKVLPDFENKQKAEQLKSNLLNLVSEINEVQDQLRQAKQKGENEDAMFLEQRV